VNDEIIIIGETTGVVEMKLNEFNVNDALAQSAEKGFEVTFVTPELVRKNDKVYIVEQFNQTN
jgi:putative protease